VTSLARKLGIGPGQEVAVVGQPAGYVQALEPLPPGVRVTRRMRRGLDIVQVFCTSKSELERGSRKQRRAVKTDGADWVSWPKRSSKLPTDLTDRTVSEAGLEAGLVDVKVCSVDETWSGLKFVRRTADR